MRIAFVTPEALPFAKTGGLADVCGALPAALEKLGHEIVIIMPYYRRVGPQEVLNDHARTATVGRNIKVYFIVHKEYFDRPGGLYGTKTGDYEDNLERFSFFCHKALGLLKELGKPFDIIHCHEWQTGLIPVILKERYAGDAFFARTRTVFSIHNLAYQGIFSPEQYAKLGVARKFFNDREIEFYGKINLMKTGIVFSDYITTVSPQYAREVQTPEFGFWIEGVIKGRRSHLKGILNGLDYERWNPESDPLVNPGYSDRDWSPKRYHKSRLQESCGFATYGEIPVFGFVGRLCYQKGLDLIENAFEDLMQRPIQMVCVGVGEDKYEKMLTRLAKKCPQKFAAHIKYDEDVAHMVYAGADFFLMPSIYEPCGLTQMISMRYGTVPVTSYVGGLIDTVRDARSGRADANGIAMSSYSVLGLLEAIDAAVGIYHQKKRMRSLIANGLAWRWSWEESAKKYVECYEECLR